MNCLFQLSLKTLKLHGEVVEDMPFLVILLCTWYPNAYVGVVHNIHVETFVLVKLCAIWL